MKFGDRFLGGGELGQSFVWEIRLDKKNNFNTDFNPDEQIPALQPQADANSCLVIWFSQFLASNKGLIQCFSSIQVFGNFKNKFSGSVDF